MKRVVNIASNGIAIILPFHNTPYTILILSLLLALIKLPLNTRIFRDGFVYLALAILFGAPFKEFNNTFALSIMTAVLTCKETNDSFSVIVFTLVGGWLGAFLLPLDWQEDYLIYPRPILIGLLFGNAVGNLWAMIERKTNVVKTKS